MWGHQPVIVPSSQRETLGTQEMENNRKLPQPRKGVCGLQRKFKWGGTPNKCCLLHQRQWPCLPREHHVQHKYWFWFPTNVLSFCHQYSYKTCLIYFRSCFTAECGALVLFFNLQVFTKTLLRMYSETF